MQNFARDIVELAAAGNEREPVLHVVGQLDTPYFVRLAGEQSGVRSKNSAEP